MTDEQKMRLFVQLALTDLGKWCDDEIARQQALLVQQTEPVGIYRTQGDLIRLQNIKRLLEVAVRKNT